MPGTRAIDLNEHSRTRARLLECALLVVAEHGVGERLVPQVCALARVTLAQFHSHFADADELLKVLADGLSNELIALIERTAGEFVDAAKRIACGVRIYLEVARECPVFAKFVARRGLAVAGPASLLHQYLPRHIASGVDTARFADSSLDAATDIIAGTTLAAVSRIAERGAADGYCDEVAAGILRALGVPGAQARRLAKVELPAVQPRAGSLLARARGQRT